MMIDGINGPLYIFKRMELILIACGLAYIRSNSTEVHGITAVRGSSHQPRF